LICTLSNVFGSISIQKFSVVITFESVCKLVDIGNKNTFFYDKILRARGMNKNVIKRSLRVFSFEKNTVKVKEI